MARGHGRLLHRDSSSPSRRVNDAITTPWDTLWWGITTMTTVGYGDVYPITPEGRFMAGVLMLLGIGLFSVVTATMTSFFVVGDRAPAGRARIGSATWPRCAKTDS